VLSANADVSRADDLLAVGWGCDDSADSANTETSRHRHRFNIPDAVIISMLYTNTAY